MLKENEIIELSDLTVALVQGEDASEFLQGQLSHDIKLVNDSNSILAAYCTPKGRVLASMLVVANPNNGYYLITKADNAMAFIKRLRMFVLRSKVNIEILNNKVYGVCNSLDSPGLNNEVLDNNVDSLSNNYSFKTHTLNQDGNSFTCVSAPNVLGDSARFWLISNDDKSNIDENIDTAQALTQWQSQDIASGLPWVIAANQDVYIPQTLNFDLINGLSFTKGCYPGQEVVARSHYRGTIKRRCAFAKADLNNLTDDQVINQEDIVGTDVFNAEKPKNPCGRVINAVTYKQDLFLLLEVQLADIDTADFRLGEAQGLHLKIQELPYSIKNE